MELTKNFTLEELTKSGYATEHGIDNTPNAEQIENLQLLATNILQPLRDELGLAVNIDSAFRCLAVNEAVGGVTDPLHISQHTKGQAADIIVPGMTPMEVIKKIVEMKLPFDQLIFEYGEWTHVSFDKDRKRGQILSKTKGVAGYPPLQL